jgi:hypothetical protein
MVFFRRKPGQAGPSNEEIAAAVNMPVEETPMPARVPMITKPYPTPAVPRQMPERFEAAKTEAEIIPEFPLPPPVSEEAEKFAPIFVKLDKYRGIISELEEMRTFVNSIKQIFSVLADIESSRDDALKVMKAAIQRLEKSMTMIDMGLLKPMGFESFPHGELEVKHIESSLGALQHQLSSMRRELENLGR